MSRRPVARRARVVGLLVVMLALVACGERGSGPVVSTAADHYPAGAAIFQRNCAVCHGPLARGTGNGPALIDAVYADLTDDDIRRAVTEGVPQTHWDFGPMPPRFGLSNSDIDEITRFLRHIQREAGTID